jgi:hypothetical protein
VSIVGDRQLMSGSPVEARLAEASTLCDAAATTSGAGEQVAERHWQLSLFGGPPPLPSPLFSLQLPNVILIGLIQAIKPYGLKYTCIFKIIGLFYTIYIYN